MFHRTWLLVPILWLLLECNVPRTQSTAPNSASTLTVTKLEDEQALISYELRPILHDGRLEFHVTLRFTGNLSGRTTLFLPSQWAGQERLFDGINGLTVETPGASMIADVDPAVRHVEHAKGARIKISYRVRETVVPGLEEQDRSYRPILNDRYFHFFGESFFVYPSRDEDAPARIVLEWRDVPTGWTLSNSFGTGQERQFVGESIRNFLHAVFTGGDFRIHRMEIRGQPVYLSVRGSWKFSDAELVGIIRRIVELERTFWDDFEFPYFLISLIPTGETCCSYGGTGLTNSFAMFVSTDKGIEQGMIRLLTHELFHSWNGDKIRMQQPATLVYWFSEGFTEYYTRLLMLQAGLIDLEQYITDYNDILYQYTVSPAHHTKNQRVVEEFWKDNFVEKIPYQRGDILAHNWNTEIRNASGGRTSLDRIMGELLEEARARRATASAESIRSIVNHYVHRDVGVDLANYIDEGATIPLLADALGPCVTIKTRRMAEFDMGFDVAAFEAKRVITGTKRNGNAYRAGLRDGQEVLRFGYRKGDRLTPVRLRIRDARGERTIEYLPQGALFDVPQYELSAEGYERDPKRCLAWFGVAP